MKKQQPAEKFSSLPNNIIDQIFQSTKEGIMITNEKMKISLVNNAFESLTGYNLSEVKGKTPRILQSGKQDADFYKKCGKTFNQRDRGRVKFGIDVKMGKSIQNA